jgi:hypothetical protein
MASVANKSGGPTHLCCPDCRLRFDAADAAYLVACPKCGELLRASSLEQMVGFRRFRFDDVPHSLPEALAASILPPEWTDDRR